MLKKRESPKDYTQGYWSALNSAEEIVRDQLTKWNYSSEAQDALGSVLAEIGKEKLMAKRLVDSNSGGNSYETKNA